MAALKRKEIKVWGLQETNLEGPLTLPPWLVTKVQTFATNRELQIQSDPPLAMT